MPIWTQASDVVDAWIGDDVPENTALISTWLEKAEREVRFRVPDLQDRITAASDLDLLGAAKDVVVSMVMRVFRNPEGIRQVNTTTGPFTESATYGGDVPGGLGITDDEIEKLRGVSNGSSAFSISMIPDTSPFSPNYVASGWL